MEEIMSTDKILAAIGVASAQGVEGLPEVIRLGNLLRKQKADIEKAETDRLLKEAAELAGAREKLQNEITRYMVKFPELHERMTAVKATGVTFHAETMAKTPEGEEYLQKANSKLAVPTVKSRQSGGGGGARVSTKDETGHGLGELIDLYATEEQKAAIQNAYDTAAKNKGSAKWQEQVKVKKVILATHPELVQK